MATITCRCCGLIIDKQVMESSDYPSDYGWIQGQLQRFTSGSWPGVLRRYQKLFQTRGRRAANQMLREMESFSESRTYQARRIPTVSEMKEILEEGA